MAILHVTIRFHAVQVSLLIKLRRNDFPLHWSA